MTPAGLSMARVVLRKRPRDDVVSLQDLLPWLRESGMGENAAVPDEPRPLDEVTDATTARSSASESVVVLSVNDVELLITMLTQAGYVTKGPVVREGAIMPGPISGAKDLPRGVHDEQAAGSYRIVQGDDARLFDWAVGPSGWKPEFFPARDELWRAHVDGDGTSIIELPEEPPSLAIFGARPCEVAAIGVLDRVFATGAHPDPSYCDRRARAFVAVVECSSPAATCFCDSMHTGPHIEAGFDLALTELDDDDGHRFVARVGSDRARALLDGIVAKEATSSDLAAREAVLEHAGRTMVRHLDAQGVAGLLERNLEHPRWAEVAERCLSCGNCTLVCPTCFCSDVRDATTIEGDVVRARTWSSCFSVDHSYLHGGAVRPTTESRYRQWMTHKLSSWWDQFDTSGCVGCGRCIAWCPVGIDITEETSAIARSDGAISVTTPKSRSLT